jgi:hypothetical protein
MQSLSRAAYLELGHMIPIDLAFTLTTTRSFAQLELLKLNAQFLQLRNKKGISWRCMYEAYSKVPRHCLSGF